MTNFRKLYDDGSCKPNEGCHPTTCVCALAGDMADEIERLRNELHLAALQIEYLQEKFQKTGTSAAILARINSVLAE